MMGGTMRTDRRSRRGAQAVEFALLLPVLLGLTSGIIDYGWYFSQHLEVLQASRDAVRSAAVLDQDVAPNTPCYTAVENARTNLNTKGFDGTGATLAAVVLDGDKVVVLTLSVPYAALFGLIPVPGAYTSTVAARLEDQGFDPCTY